ncbi:MAG: DUF1761 domain-containing protein [Pseudomonadota bacterium]
MSIGSILLATVAGMVLGALWYSPLMFGNAWLAALGKRKEALGSAKGPMIGSMLACLLTALALALLLLASGADTVGKALGIGLIAGLGLVFPAMLSDSLFCGWGRRLLLIQCGYRISYIALMSVILVA